jgi:hypothetical protein
MGFIEPACAVQRALRDDMRHFMHDDARNRAREDAPAVGGGFISKLSMEHLRNSIAVHMDEGLDLIVNHQHPT